MVTQFDGLTGEPLSVDGFFERISAIDAAWLSEPYLAACAQALAQLSTNRSLLWDHIASADSLERWESTFAPPQSVILGSSDAGVLRANIWLSHEESVFERDRRDRDAHDIAHNHDVRFLTVGYFGPGYDTDLFEIEPADFGAAPGQRVELHNHRRERLSVGRVFYFDRWRDVHLQYEPSALSISINFILREDRGEFEQLMFDMRTSTAIGPPLVSESSQLTNVIEAAALFGNEATAARFASIADHHRHSVVRAAARRALGKTILVTG